jgi:hypothetical protein
MGRHSKSTQIRVDMRALYQVVSSLVIVPKEQVECRLDKEDLEQNLPGQKAFPVQHSLSLSTHRRT